MCYFLLSNEKKREGKKGVRSIKTSHLLKSLSYVLWYICIFDISEPAGFFALVVFYGFLICFLVVFFEVLFCFMMWENKKKD